MVKVDLSSSVANYSIKVYAGGARWNGSWMVMVDECLVNHIEIA